MISYEWVNKILNNFTGNTSAVALNKKETVYMGLCETEPNAANGTVTGEPTADSYSRELIGGSSNLIPEKCFAAAANGTIVNAKEIQFNTAREPWGTMKYFFFSETIGGPAYMWGSINNGTGIVVGDTSAPGSFVPVVPVFYEGELQASIDVAEN